MGWKPPPLSALSGSPREPSPTEQEIRIKLGVNRIIATLFLVTVIFIISILLVADKMNFVVLRGACYISGTVFFLFGIFSLVKWIKYSVDLKREMVRDIMES